MDRISGVHLYVNIKNLMDIINKEEEKDDDLKRTLHRLQTYFVGHTKLIKKYSGIVEKYTGSRSHILLKNEDDNISCNEILEIAVACFVFNNNIFNKLTKYSKYPKFSIHAGIDYGDYFEYDIDDGVNESEFTTIGRVANNSAKIQSYAPKNYIYITKKFYEKLDNEFQEVFVELTEDEKKEFNDKIRSKIFYKAHYNEIFDKDKMVEIEEGLSDVKERVEKESNDFNILDIKFESCTKKISFEGLSLKGRNKKLENAGVICADIRGFTKLFYENDKNLDDLSEVMEDIYHIMGVAVLDSGGTKVQYQGDRIIAIYNDFSDAENYIIRMLKAAFKLNEKIQNLNEEEKIKERLNNRKITIGIGCSSGKVIATRLGMNGNKDNIVLSDCYKKANKCEDIYADSNEIVIGKELKDIIDSKAGESEIPEFLALQELFTAISTNGYYVTTATLDEFNELVEQKKELKNSAEELFISDEISSHEKQISNIGLKPWGDKTNNQMLKTHNINDSLIINDFDSDYNFSRYLTLVKNDFNIVKKFFPLLKLTILPTIKPKEIFITGKLIPYEVFKKCNSDSDINRYSIYILATYPSNFNDENIYVEDMYKKIDWSKIPYEHQHLGSYRNKEILCTHHERGEINSISKSERTIAILFSAWKLYIQYKEFQKTNKWTLKGLPHGHIEAIEKLKLAGSYYK
ncbi:adenylate/guanylate cyclase domain-containing protein, partial [Bacteroidales bacterium MSK.15.36]|nr:adenylate/guanylate cyclase domain-containing protein [Bacteroidales bacterium MSK.15.36]